MFDHNPRVSAWHSNGTATSQPHLAVREVVLAATAKVATSRPATGCQNGTATLTMAKQS